MATGGGVKEVGIRLKVGAQGTDALETLKTALRELGVNTEELDAKAEALSAELVKTGEAGGKAAIDQDKLAEAAAEAGKAAADLGRAAREGATGTAELGTSGAAAKAKLGEMKLELAAAAATAYTIGRALGGAAKDASGFESAMAEVSTLVKDTSGMQAQSDAVRKLALDYGGDAQGQAKALYQIISAGAQEGAQAIGVLDQANKLAVGGVTDIGTAADGLTSIMNAYGDKAGTAAEVSDALFVAMKAGKTTVGELSGSIGQVAPIAATAGVGLDELLSGVAALTKGGVSTSQAMTQIRGAISAVINPSQEATKTAQALGLQFDAQALKAKGLSGFLQDVREKTGGNTETMARLFGSVEALGGVLSLTGNQAKDFSDILAAQAQRAGATDEAFARVSQTSEFAAKRFQAALADVRISLGQAVTAFTPLLEVVTDVINVFNSLPSPVKSVVTGLGAVAIAAGPLVLAIGSVTRAVGLATTALGLQGAAAAALVAPATAAAGATAAMGAASAAAAAPIGLAATATTLLSRAMLALRAALPIGLILTVASLAAEFFRVKKAAEEGDEAVRKMLSTPVPDVVPKAAKEAAKATEDMARAAVDSVKQLDAQAEAARLAAQALGVDLARSAGKVSEEFATKLKRLDDIIKGLDALKKQGVETGTLVADALGKMIDSAKNSEEFDALRAKIVALGTTGEVSKQQIQGLMDALEKGAKKALGEVSELDKALKAFGLTGQAEADKLADNLGKAWKVIRDDATVSLRDKQEAFQKYAEAAVKANGGVVDSSLKAQAEGLGMGKMFEEAGQKTERTMKTAAGSVKGVGDAARESARGMGELADETDRAGKAAERASSGYGLLNTAVTAARNAAIATGPAAGSFGELMNQTASGGITRTVGTGQAVNKPVGVDSTYVMYGYDIRGLDARGNAVGGGWKVTALPQQTMSPLGPGSGFGVTGNAFWQQLNQPGGTTRTPAPVPAPAPSSSTQPGGANADANLRAALAIQEAERLRAGGAAATQVVEIRFSLPSGQAFSVTAGSQAQAEALARELRDLYERRGG